ETSWSRIMILTKLKVAFVILAMGGAVAPGIFAQQSQKQWSALAESSRQTDFRVPEENPSRTDRFGDPLPAGAVARLGTVRMRSHEDVDGVAFSPDGKTLATGDGGAPMKIRFWDVATGKEVRRFEANSVTRSIAFSPDGKLLATGDYVGFVHL